MSTQRRTDDEAEAERVLVTLLRRAAPWQRARQLESLIKSRNDLILADLRRRYPRAGAGELRVRLAARLLPRETVVAMFGWDPDVKGY